MYSLHVQPLVIVLTEWLKLAQTTLVQTKFMCLRSLFGASGHRINRVAQNGSDYTGSD